MQSSPLHMKTKQHIKAARFIWEILDEAINIINFY